MLIKLLLSPKLSESHISVKNPKSKCKKMNRFYCGQGQRNDCYNNIIIPSDVDIKITICANSLTRCEGEGMTE